jgi:hypothetical protein
MPLAKQLTGPERKKLREALLNAFPEPQDFTTFLSDRLDRNFAALVSAAYAYKNQLASLITTANAEGWIIQLASGALEYLPNNPALREFAFFIQVSSISPADLDDAHQRTVNQGDEAIDPAVWRELLGVREAQVCRMEVGLDQGTTSYGTGFLVGPTTLLTNYHVLEPVFKGLEGKATKKGHSAKPENVVCRFDYKQMPSGVLNTGIEYKLATKWDLDHSESFTPVDQDASNEQLDYALVRLKESAGTHTVGKKDGTDGETRGHLTPLSPYPFTPGTGVYILQHLDGGPLKMALDTKGMLGLFSQGNRTRYTTKTEGGSSGSPCFNQKLELIALHHAGDPNFERNAQWNQGIPFDRILARMVKQGTRKLLGT